MAVTDTLLASAAAVAGENIDRNGACKDTSKSVIVKTTDTCPCSYPNNYFSEWLAFHPLPKYVVVATCLLKFRCNCGKLRTSSSSSNYQIKP
jgi:hypothetical protein